MAEVLLGILSVETVEEKVMSDLNTLKVVVHDLDHLIETSPELKRRLAEIEERAKREELEQEADWAYEAEMQTRMRHAS